VENLNDIMIFVRVAERKSMSRAAKELHLSAPYVTKRIKLLEDELGTQLLIRSTRYLSLTEAGEKYFRRCSEIMAQLKVAHEEVTDMRSGLRGSVRVYSSQGIGEHFLVPIITDFIERYPEITVDLRIADQSTTPTEKGVDLTIRSAELSDSSLVGRELGRLHYEVCAAPALLRKGAPRSPQDLAKFNCLIHTVQPSANCWTFTEGNGVSTVMVKGNFCSSSGVVVYRACKQGAGIARLPEYDVRRGVGEGHLQVLFPGRLTFTRVLRAYYPRTPHVPARIETFIDFVQERINRLSAARQYQA
jgi:DNA-binding transcriptional LysR family regulator